MTELTITVLLLLPPCVCLCLIAHLRYYLKKITNKGLLIFETEGADEPRPSKIDHKRSSTGKGREGGTFDYLTVCIIFYLYSILYAKNLVLNLVVSFV